MQTNGNARDHFWRVIKMAKANRVDLSTALDEGKITSHAYADMITGCQGCADVGKCDRLLAAVDRLPEVPAYCVNHETFAALKSG
jgi:hypothetical protein